MEKINWKVTNFLISKELKSLIVVNDPQKKEDIDSEFFSGVVVNADESKTNSVLYRSNQFRKSYFEHLDRDKVKVTWGE